MAMQTQMSSFADRYGQRAVAANEKNQDVAPSLGGQQKLPAGVRDGLARLQEMVTKQYQDDKNGPGTKGLTFLQVTCVAVSPEVNDKGQRVSGIQTRKFINLCDLPQKGNRAATTFEEGYDEMRAMLIAFGVPPCRETRATDPTGKKAEAYWFAAMRMLCDPSKPRYIKFSTRTWQPPRPMNARPDDPNPDPVVIENWEGVATPEEVAKFNARYDPAAGASDAPPNGQHVAGPAPTAEPPTDSQIHSMSPDESSNGQEFPDLDAEVTHLVNIAMDDPEGATDKGQAAQLRLLELAWAGGWSEDQTTAANWEEVGDMALNPSDDTTNEREITVGSKWQFCKRTNDGSKVKDNKGVTFAPMEVEVVTINDDKTCTVKTTKDGKVVTDVKTRKPVMVKFEWLE